MNETTDRWRDRLSEYLDDELEGSERTRLEEHLARCAECRSTLEELRRVLAQARQLVNLPPRTDLWPGISDRLGVTGTVDHHRAGAPGGRPATAAVRRRRSWTLSTPQLAAAAILLIALSSSIAWQVAEEAGSRRPPPVAPAALAERVPPAYDLLPASRTASHDYRSAINQLERVLADREQRLDTMTVRKVRERLALIDRAIEEARQALASDPSNAYLNRHLAGTIRRKLDLLRRTAALTEL